MKRIIIVLTLLIALLLILVVWQNRDNDEKTLLFKYDKNEISLNLAKFESENITTKRDDKFVGYSLQKIIDKLKINREKMASILFKSSDGGNLKIDMAELPNIFLVHNAEKNYNRLVISTDDFPQRWLKYINEIELLHD